MHDFGVDKDLCVRCKECVRVCAWAAIEIGGEGIPIHSPSRESLCIACQQCLAVCPTGALFICGVDPKGCVKSSQMPDISAVEALVRLRRSARFFKKEPVKRELLDRLIAIAANAPTGTNSRMLRYTIVEGGALERFREAVYGRIEELEGKGLIPEKLWYLKLMAKAWRQGRDVIFRDAPHLLLVSSGREATTPFEDGIISLATFDLVAQSAGVGTLWLGFAAFIMELAPDLGQALGIGAEREICYAMLAGVPDVTFRRGVKRDTIEIERAVFGP